MSCLNKTFFVVEDHTVTNIGLVQLIEQKTELKCSGSALSKSEAEEKLKALANGSNETGSRTSALPELLILDLFLGEESGLDLLREVRTDYPEIKILVYSMYAKPGILSMVLEAGAHGFVEKSAPEPILITAVKSILAGETFVQQNLVAPLFTYKTMFDGLTKQEQNVFKKILERKSKEQIAEELNIIPRSVDNYFTHIFEKTACKNVHELIKKFGE
ncbi:MAG: response regulator transcription factor [Treponema sp.]|nr:response regulator transcription factor [Treponema sp.]